MFESMFDSDVVTRVYLAQRHAAQFGRAELAEAARQAAALSAENGWHLTAADGSGERIVGAASLVENTWIADTSRRFDGLKVLVLAGVVAGPWGLARAAEILRSQGALEVHCAFLGGVSTEILEFDSVIHLRTDSAVERTMRKNKRIRTRQS